MGGSFRTGCCVIVMAIAAVVSSCGAAERARVIKLPQPRLKGTVSVEETLRKRRSIRSFSDRNLTLEEISQLAWAAQGITEERKGFRTAPSAGATYPLELYVFTKDGVYRYDPRSHSLEERDGTDRRAELARAALGQRFVRQAPVVFVITAVYERTSRRYGARATMYVHMEAGHVAQNIHLQAVALGLGSVLVGAFRDEEVSRILGLGGAESPLYIIPVGQPAAGKAGIPGECFASCPSAGKNGRDGWRNNRSDEFPMRNNVNPARVPQTAASDSLA